MPTPQQRLDLDRVLKSIDATAAVVILVGDKGELETATTGIDNDEALFEICFSVARQLAEEIFENLPAQQRKLQIALPTLEQARQLGILRRPREQ